MKTRFAIVVKKNILDRGWFEKKSWDYFEAIIALKTELCIHKNHTLFLKKYLSLV